MKKLFTHTDLDGIGCAILARYVFHDYIHIEYCDYSSINDKVKKFLNERSNFECSITITDISVSEDLAYEITNNTQLNTPST